MKIKEGKVYIPSTELYGWDWKAVQRLKQVVLDEAMQRVYDAQIAQSTGEGQEES